MSRRLRRRRAEGTRKHRRRRLRSSRRSLTITLASVAVVAVAILGLVNSIFAFNVFTNAIDTQLSSVQNERAAAVTAAFDRVRAEIGVLAVDRSIAEAVVEFTGAFTDLEAAGVMPTPEQDQALETFYNDAAQPPGARPPVNPASRYLQYNYLAANPYPVDQRDQLVDPGDGSAYSAVHAARHPALAERARRLGLDDLLLLSTEPEGVVVYSTNKFVDFGTSLTSGPYEETTLAKALLTRLATVPTGGVILVDFGAYPPEGTLPTMFAAAAVRLGSETVGAVVVPLPRGILDGIMTFEHGWSDVGLGASGETYLVGPDRLMRSVSRAWVEDPDGYLEKIEGRNYPDEVADTIRRYDSTVMAQPVDTAAVTAALEDHPYDGTTANYLGTRTRTFAAPLQLRDLSWVIVTGFSSRDATRPIRSYLVFLGLIALVLLPIVALIGYLLAIHLTRPIGPLVDAVNAITDGDLDTQVPDLGRNEYGNLGNRINTLTTMLREHEEQRVEADKAIDDLLAAALPARVVASARRAVQEGDLDGLTDMADVIDTATVIAVMISGYFDADGMETESAVDESASLAADIDRLVDEAGIERIRSGTSDYLFAAGLGSPESAADEALRFVRAMRRRLDRLAADSDADGIYRIGVASGLVASGLTLGNELAVGILGAPVTAALSLAGMAPPNEVLIDETAAEQLTDRADLVPIAVTDLQGRPVSAFTLRNETDDTDPNDPDA